MKKIMLIDDDPTMLLLLRTLLEMEGFAVATWSGGVNIYEEFEATAPEIVLLDVNLRGASGFDVLQNIRGNDQHRDTVVIMASGMDVREQCTEMGANDFLLKPYMPNDLLKALNTHVRAEV